MPAIERLHCSFLCLYVGLTYQLVSERTICDIDDSKVSHEGKLNMQDCSSICNKKHSALFVVSRQDTGYCEGDNCLCYCYPGLFKDGSCRQKYWGNDDLYSINQNTDRLKGMYFFPSIVR